MAQQDFSVAGNLRVVGSTTVYGQVAIGGSALNLATFASDMIGNVNAANARVNAANAAITSTNSSMKTYVDSTVSSAVIAASGYGNTIVAAYLPINPTITAIQANMSAANASTVGLQPAITAANLNITSLQANIIAANIRASATDSNVSYLQGVAQYMTANILSNGAVIASNLYAGTGNIIVGNVNASGNLVMTGTDATTIRFVRSSDTNVTPGEVYGNIDYAGEDNSGSSSGTRARISSLASGSSGQSEVVVYTSTIGYTLTESFKINNAGYFGLGGGFIRQEIPNLGPNGGDDFEPFMNDSSQSGIRDLTTSSVQKLYNSWGETEIGQSFVMMYSGFAGGDRANVDIGGYHVQLGIYPLTQNNRGTTELEIYVQGVYAQDPTVEPPVLKRLRKRWIATISYASSTGLYTILDQQLCEAVYNSDPTNFPAGAANAGKVYLQANATPGYQSVYLRFDAPTSAATTSATKWQWTMKIRTIDSYLVV